MRIKVFPLGGGPEKTVEVQVGNPLTGVAISEVTITAEDVEKKGLVVYFCDTILTRILAPTKKAKEPIPARPNSTSPIGFMMSLQEALAKVATLPYSTVKAILRSHGISLWLDDEPIVRRLLAEKIEAGEILDPTNEADTVIILT